MADKVVDSSALCAVIYDEPAAPAVLERISNGFLFGPALLEVEVANVCLTKRRQAPDDLGAIMLQFAEFRRFNIIEANPNTPKTIDMAHELSLSVYDAIYLALAMELRLELVTLDKRLATAAKKIGVRA